LKRLGRVLHLSNNNNLILRTKIQIKPQTIVLDDQLNHIGKINDVFGPVTNPYIAIKPSVKNPNKYVGQILYLRN
jgi:RNA-binding protein